VAIGRQHSGDPRVDHARWRRPLRLRTAIRRRREQCSRARCCRHASLCLRIVPLTGATRSLTALGGLNSAAWVATVIFYLLRARLRPTRRPVICWAKSLTLCAPDVRRRVEPQMVGVVTQVGRDSVMVAPDRYGLPRPGRASWSAADAALPHLVGVEPRSIPCGINGLAGRGTFCCRD